MNNIPEKPILENLRESLMEKRANLLSWLQVTPPAVKQERLGFHEEGPVRDHIHKLEAAIQDAEAGTIGICEVCHEPVETELLEMDYTACVCLDHLSRDERRELEAEIELAQRVQQTLLPREVPLIPGLEVAAYSRPAQFVGGDYFDFFRFQSADDGMAIADVAGHGLSASLHMASMQTLLRTLVPAHRTPLEVVQQIHGLIRHNIRFTTFVTLFLGAYDRRNRTLLYCNAGHNPALLRRDAIGREPGFRWLKPTGPAIGLLEESTYRGETITLRPGDTLVLYTDGVTEAMDGEGRALGRERLAGLIQSGADRSARELLTGIRAGLERHHGDSPLKDDLTLLVCKVRE